MSDNLVVLSDGNTATLRPVVDVSERLRRPIASCMARISPDGQAVLSAIQEAARRKEAGEEEETTPSFSEADLQALNEMNDHAIVALVESWSFPEAITFDAVTSRKAKDYDKLRLACAPAVGSLFVDTGASADPTSPTAPSNGLNTSSGEGVSIHATDSQPTPAPTAF